MSWPLFIVILTIVFLSLWFYLARRARRNALGVGQPAPDFKLIDQNGEAHTLSDFRGEWLALYFYPKDDTPGCTRQACGFRDDFEKLKAMGVEVVGISVDTVESHDHFAQKFSLQFPLLADTTTETAARYHSLLNLGIIKFARRNTFLVDPEGRIAKVYLSVNAARNAKEIVDDLKLLKEAE